MLHPDGLIPNINFIFTYLFIMNTNTHTHKSIMVLSVEVNFLSYHHMGHIYSISKKEPIGSTVVIGVEIFNTEKTIEVQPMRPTKVSGKV